MSDSLFAVHLKATARQVLPVYILATIGMLVIYWQDSRHLSDIQNLVSLTALFIIFAVLIVLPQIICLVRIFQSLYGQYAYLTHTLPLSTGKILRSFIGLSLFWNAITLPIVVIFGFLALNLRNLINFITSNNAPADAFHSVKEVIDYGITLWQNAPGTASILIISMLLITFLSLLNTALIWVGWIVLAQRFFSARHIFIGLFVVAVVVQLVSMPLVFGLNMVFQPAAVIHLLPGDVLHIDYWMTEAYSPLNGGVDYLADHKTAIFLFPWAGIISNLAELAIAYAISYWGIARRTSLN